MSAPAHPLPPFTPLFPPFCRCNGLDTLLATVCEEGRGRYEALAGALLQASAAAEGAAVREQRIRSLEAEVARLSAALAGAGVFALPPLCPVPKQLR